MQKRQGAEMAEGRKANIGVGIDHAALHLLAGRDLREWVRFGGAYRGRRISMNVER
jgi:hypothetical protein